MSDLITWKTWLEHNYQAQQDLNAVPVNSAKQALESAEHRLYDCLWPIAPAGTKVSYPPTSEQVEGVLSKLAAVMNKNVDVNNRARYAEWARQASMIKEAKDDWENAQADLEAAIREKQQAEQALRDVQKQMPTPSPKALEAIQLEIDGRQQQVGKIDATLNSMKDSASIAVELEQKAQAASEEVERLEAQALLGDVDEAAKGQAATTLAKARKASEKAAEQAEKQDAAKRGLEKMRSGLHEELADLEALRKGVGFEVGKATMEAQEQALIKAIEGIDLETLLANINAARDQANEHAPDGQSYDSASMQVKLPLLYAVSAPDSIEY